MSVTVFTKPRCPQCEATKRQFTKQGIDFDVVDLTENPERLAELQEAGYRQAPVVVTEESSWAGYRPDLIKQYSLTAQKVNA
ncbi:MAG: glutaredoxin-like protein NrdH [Bifidobacteriaceae bacterium]|nr:glutaredoxin-like protein NrdH [Bifidobacteriaceae bacterium]